MVLVPSWGVLLLSFMALSIRKGQRGLGVLKSKAAKNINIAIIVLMLAASIVMLFSGMALLAHYVRDWASILLT